MDEERSLILPLVLGLLSVAFVGISLWDAYHSRSLPMLIVALPVISVVGMIFSLIIRKTIRKHKGIWLLGFLGCLAGLMGFLLIEVLSLYNMGLALG